jgi:hypothetical protein
MLAAVNSAISRSGFSDSVSSGVENLALFTDIWLSRKLAEVGPVYVAAGHKFVKRP